MVLESFGRESSVTSLEALLSSRDLGEATVETLLEEIAKTGLALDDERIASDVAAVKGLPLNHKYSQEQVAAILRKNLLLETALCQQLVISNFEDVSQQLDECYQTTLKETRTLNKDGSGTVCTSTPKLARVNPSTIAASFCSIHGQRWNRGSFNDRFTAQEVCGPLLYCMALKENGMETVHQYVGREPSPECFGLLLDSHNKPFNPFVHSGLIMMISMIKPGLPMADRFNFVREVWAKATGQKVVGYANSFYLSQRNRGNIAFCNGYLMNDRRAFPGGEELDQEAIQEIINLYFMNCSIEVTCEELAIFAGTLAGGGVCPTTNTRVFSPDDVRCCLSMMSSCGMNDFSGSLQFTFGYPCKSGSSGFTISVIPNLGGFCTFSPKLDENLNSVFGLRFAANLVRQFPLHTFDSYVVQDSRVYSDLLSRKGLTLGSGNKAAGNQRESSHHELFYAVSAGNAKFVRKLFARGIDVNHPDYDLRTPLHIAASSGHLEIVKLLVLFGARADAIDRYGNSALNDAELEGHSQVAEWLRQNHAIADGAPGGRMDLGQDGDDEVDDQSETDAEEFADDVHQGKAQISHHVDLKAELDTIKEGGISTPASDSSLSNSTVSATTIGSPSNAGSISSQRPYALVCTTSGLIETTTSAAAVAASASESEEEGTPNAIAARQRVAKAASTMFVRPEEAERWIVSISSCCDKSGNNSFHPPSEDQLLRTLNDDGIRTEGTSLQAELQSGENNNGTGFLTSRRSSTSSRLSAEKPRKTLKPSRVQSLVLEYPQIRKSFQGQLAISDFSVFKEIIIRLAKEAENNRDGHVATYIPQLARVDPEKFGIGVCSVDAQRFTYGDANIPFCVQSCMKPVSYCIAQELIGEDLVHRHVGHEPSGLNFNELTLNTRGLPHNPLINAGAIVTCSLILPEAKSEDRFDFVTSVWSDLTGGVRPGFSNETFLGEFATADRNFCLGYLMKEKEAFPEYVNSSTALREVLEFYFSCCSLELDCDSMSVVAATLANGGINPVTQKRVFRADTVRNCLSIMASSGMYDFSGEFQFTIGVPSKSGVSGALLIVVPNVMGLCVWSPRLDKLGNSARGLEFCSLLQEELAIHRYSLLRGVSKNFDVRDWSRSLDAQRRAQRLIEAATRGDLRTLQLLISEGNLSVDCKDYDGRTALHLAASEGHLRFVKMLQELGADLSPVDRWGNTPLSDANHHKHEDISEFLLKNGAKVGHSLRAKPSENST